MRNRKSQDARRVEILEAARTLFANQGYGACQMEDIRKAAGLSRGGLYHHFDNKAAILAALIEAETKALAGAVEREADPIIALLKGGSIHMGAEVGILGALHGKEEVRLYLSLLQSAQHERLGPVLEAAIAAGTTAGRYAEVNARHTAGLFLATNDHINHGTLLEEWSGQEAAGFAALALTAFARLLEVENVFAPLIAELERESS